MKVTLGPSRNFAAAVAFVLFLSGCAETTDTSATSGTTASASPSPMGEEVDRQDMGEDWPLTVDSGTVYCEEDGQVLFRSEGVRYAVNRRAVHQRPELQDIAAIWADEPGGQGGHRSLTPLINAGLALCGE